MKTIAVAVVCSECGKRLKGIERLRGLGYDVRPHQNESTGRRCWGARLTNHRRAT